MQRLARLLARLAPLLEEEATDKAARHELLQYIDELAKHFGAAASLTAASTPYMAASSLQPLQRTLSRILQAAGCEDVDGYRLARLLVEGPRLQEQRRELLQLLDELAMQFGSSLTHPGGDSLPGFSPPHGSEPLPEGFGIGAQ